MHGFLCIAPRICLRLMESASHPLESLRDRGLAGAHRRLIYDAFEFEGLHWIAHSWCSSPSLYDQRLIRDGTVGRLQDLGIAVHVRSVLLQGLLLQSPHQSHHLPSEFREHHANGLNISIGGCPRWQVPIAQDPNTLSLGREELVQALHAGGRRRPLLPKHYWISLGKYGGSRPPLLALMTTPSQRQVFPRERACLV